jgi:hypothetical protein
MVFLNVDEAYAFDYLSILEVKKIKTAKSYDAWNECYIYLKNQFTEDKWFLMINSEEYRKMIEANQLTFEAVDKAKNNEVSAKEVDYCNFQRHSAKQNFQKKFFNKNLTEEKFGYEKYENRSINSSQE